MTDIHSDAAFPMMRESLSVGFCPVNFTQEFDPGGVGEQYTEILDWKGHYNLNIKIVHLNLLIQIHKAHPGFLAILQAAGEMEATRDCWGANGSSCSESGFIVLK